MTELRQAGIDFTIRKHRCDPATRGAHKAMFGTHSAACTRLLLLRPTLANRALLASRGAFDAAVARAKAFAETSGALRRIRAGLRA